MPLIHRPSLPQPVPAPRAARRLWQAIAALGLVLGAAAPTWAGTTLPPEVRAALQRARIPADAVSVFIEPVGSTASSPRLHLNEHAPVNPASLMKLPTTMAALDRLGPAFSWRTPVWLAGPVRDGLLDGDLHLQGQGDPGLVQERLWMLLQRVQAAGVRVIAGDIVLDGSAFSAPEADPGDFDGDALRPYNVLPRALLLNQHSVIYSFTPDAAAGVARVSVLPRLADAQVDATVPLAAGPCADWRRILQANFGTDGRARFTGRYPTACGELNWPVADPVPATFNARLLRALWAGMGGTLLGQVREGLPPSLPPSLEHRSAPLTEAVRDINKFSNNVMAQQVFLTLAAQASPGLPATPEAARAVVRAWLQDRLGEGADGAVVDNGSGLSRVNRLSAAQLGRLLQQHFDSATMPELMASLPVAGLDGTLRRSRAPAGRAHLKTGSLRDVAGLAGYVLGDSGQRYVFVALMQHPNAGFGAARPSLDALVQWVMRDLPSR